MPQDRRLGKAGGGIANTRGAIPSPGHTSDTHPLPGATRAMVGQLEWAATYSAHAGYNSAVCCKARRLWTATITSPSMTSVGRPVMASAIDYFNL